MALLRPARRTGVAEVVAVASRSRAKAERYAKRHRIPKAYVPYDALLRDPDVDAVYIPLPNSLHAQWALAAFERGKHVLCEKPLASGEREAKEMAAAAGGSGLVAMEAFHYRYHPLWARVQAIVASGELGELRHLDAVLQAPILRPGDIRWDADLAGGAAMDMGCYAVDAVCSLASGEPDVLTASGVLTRGGVDRSFEARLAFPRGVEARVRASMLGAPMARVEVRGTRGRLVVWNPFLPHLFYRFTVEVDGAKRRETVAGGATYDHQLRAFAAAVNDGAPVPTHFDDSVTNMRVLDQIRILIGVHTAW
jgi:predicted dehydrogenase